MKRIFNVIIILVMMFCLSGCSDSDKRDAVLEYINNDCVDMQKIENELLASYDSVSGANYENDEKMYRELTTNTIELARELNEKAVKIGDDIHDVEVQEVHRIYMNYSSKLLSTIGLMVLAIENQDVILMSQVNEKLNDANNLALDFRREISELAAKYNVLLLME